MLIEMERAGAIYAAGDPIIRLTQGGWSVFRLRLFVNPGADFRASHGATQDMQQVIALATRIQAAGGEWMLDLHYSDTWADPKSQIKPAAWAGLSPEQLEQRVHDYTAQTLDLLATKGLYPRVVQVGNEITNGMLFPDGQLAPDHAAGSARQWQRLARLVNAGVRAVREHSTHEHPTQAMIHLHSGGGKDVVHWFMDHFTRAGGEFDCIGLSFYPAWRDDLDILRWNLLTLATRYRKPIWVVETSYPSRGFKGLERSPELRWPITPAGQAAFLESLDRVVRDTPHGLGAGIVWWYPEAIPLEGRFIWRGGAEGLFDPAGRALPAVDVPIRLGR
jgi:arabinogalactan endo-1,4-beta-galactosidase